jgi:hypothetical protein
MSETHCGIRGCQRAEYDEGVCFFHYPLWEYWGYDLGGYVCYLQRGRIVGRRKFSQWLRALDHQAIIDIFSRYPWNLMRVGQEAHLT